MVWRATEPQGTTEVPIGAGYVRDNWAYLETVLKKCLVFNSAAPAEDGNANMIQFKVASASQTPNLANGAVLYGRTEVNGAISTFSPWWAVYNAAPSHRDRYKGVLCTEALVHVNLPNTNGEGHDTWTKVFDMAGYAPFCGTINIFQEADPRQALVSPIYWDGIAVYCPTDNDAMMCVQGDSFLNKVRGVGTTVEANNRSAIATHVFVRFIGVIP